MRKVLMVCSGNQDRSPTAAALLAEMRAPVWVASAGTSPSALNRLTEELLEDADVVMVMEKHHAEHIQVHFGDRFDEKVKVLEIHDIYSRGDPRLKNVLRDKLREALRLPLGVG